MRVLLIAPNWSPLVCGIGDYTSYLAQALHEAGTSVSILTRKISNIRIQPDLDMHSVVSSWRSPTLLRNLSEVNALKADIVHLQYEGFGFDQSFVLPLFWKSLSSPRVLTMHEIWFKSAIHKWRDSLLWNSSDQVIVNDQSSLERFQKLSTRSATKIGVGANLPITEWSGNSQDVLKVGYFGFLNRTKAVDLLFEAFDELVNKRKLKLKLVLIGPFDPDRSPDHRAFWELSRKLGNNVEFTGELSASAASARLAGCDMAVLPYLDGASPRRGSLQACMAMGIPVISVKSRFEESDLIDGKNLLYAPSLSGKHLAQTIARLSEDRDLRSKISQGAKLFGQKYRWNQIAQTHVTIYQNLLI